MGLNDNIETKNESTQKKLTNSEGYKAEIANTLDNYLTEEEKKIIDEVPNPEIRGIIMQIINPDHPWIG